MSIFAEETKRIYFVRENSLRGFSLLEVIVAMLVLSLIAAGMFGMFVGGRGFVIRAGHKTEAINLAQDKIEEFKSMIFGDINPTGSPDAETEFSGGISAERSWTVGNIAEGKKVTVTVGWTEAGSSKTEEIVTLIADLAD